MIREYRLLDAPDAGHSLERYVQVAQGERVGDLAYGWEDRWSEFERSPEFQALTDRERSLARYTIKRTVEDETPWLIGKNDDGDESLHGLPSPRSMISATLDDAVILSGACGWEIASECFYEDRGAKQLLGPLSLQDYINLGVAAALYGDNSDGTSDLSYFVADAMPGTIVQQTVGGTFHGDFIAHWTRFATSGPVVDPTGMHRDFAPALEADVVRAYHSVETELAIGMLTYLAGGDHDRLEETKRALVAAIDAADRGRGGGNFADFGTNSRGHEHAIFVDDFRQYHPDDSIHSFMVTPGDRNMRMELVAKADGVSLDNIRQTREDDGVLTTERLGTMYISREEIPQFIATMAAASAGRTSLAEIRAAITQAKVWS